MPKTSSFFLFILIILVTQGAVATLGQPENSTDRDLKKFAGASRVRIAKPTYTIHQITSDGNTINEYISPTGMIFAITWQGISHPDLSVLLGSHYSEYKSSSARARRHWRQGPQNILTSKAVVRREGHMRDVRGRAFVPDLIPNGINVEELP